MNKIRLAMTFSMLLSTQVFAFGTIPVIDVSNLAQSIKQVAHLLEEIQLLQQQLQQAKQQFNAMQGVRGMGNILGSAYDNDMNNINTNAILNANQIQPAQYYALSSDTAPIYQAQNEAAAAWQGRSQKFLQQSQAHFSELQKLLAKVNDAPDQKDILDLQARIQAEHTLLQNKLIQLSMMQSEAAAQQALNQQRAVQYKLEMTQKPPTPLTMP